MLTVSNVAAFCYLGSLLAAVCVGVWLKIGLLL